MKIVFQIFLFLVSYQVSAQFHHSIFPNKIGSELLDNLVSTYKPQTVLDYGEARDLMYSQIYNLGDTVYCVYSSHGIHLPDGVDPSTFLHMNGSSNGINTEHTYPQSKGAGEGNPRSDIHHLFPSRAGVNTARDNFPFFEINDNETDTWYYLTNQLQSIPSSNIDSYSERVNGQFEPPEYHKGNVARAMFYFYTMYKNEADSADPDFFEIQRETLCAWYYLDPVDLLEYERNFQIAEVQDEKPNPYILDCSLAESVKFDAKWH